MDVTGQEIRDLIETTGTIGNLSDRSSSDLFKSIGVDSLDMYTILLVIEEKYNLKIPDDDVNMLDSIDSIVMYLHNK